MTPNLAAFISETYFPYAVTALRPSTIRTYRALWRSHPLTAETVPECQRWIAGKAGLAPATLSHLKAFYSGVFGYAVRLGLRADNPMAGVRLPRGQEREAPGVYTAEEIRLMLTILPEEAADAVALAAYTGLRRSEIRGLQVGDVREEGLVVERTFDGRYQPTKSLASRGIVPVAPELRSRLQRILSAGRGITEPLLAGSTGQPLDLHNLAERTIRPALAAVSLPWRGWHAFRRATATILHEQGVPDVVIQRVLRHSSVALTQRCYIRVVPGRVREAVEGLTFEGVR